MQPPFSYHALEKYIFYCSGIINVLKLNLKLLIFVSLFLLIEFLTFLIVYSIIF